VPEWWKVLDEGAVAWAIEDAAIATAARDILRVTRDSGGEAVDILGFLPSWEHARTGDVSIRDLMQMIAGSRRIAVFAEIEAGGDQE
jgi:hypothetical protein